MQKIGIFYGSTSGNTENVAKQIQQELGSDNAELFNVADAKASDLEQFSNIIFGTSTWGIGDLQDDFESFISEIEAANLSGKKVAIFGLGDAESYSDSFVSGMGTIYEAIQEKGCEVIGFVPASEYSFDDSTAVVDGKFVGLPIDEDNQSDMTAERVENWVADLKSNF